MAQSFHNCATVVRKYRRFDDPFGLAHQLEIGQVLASLGDLAFDAVVGAVAISHVFVGRVEQVVLVVGRFLRLGTFGALGGHVEAGHVPILLGVGFEVVEKLPCQRPARSCCMPSALAASAAADRRSAQRSSIQIIASSWKEKSSSDSGISSAWLSHCTNSAMAATGSRRSNKVSITRT